MSKPDWIPFENNYVLVLEFDSSQESADKYRNGRRDGPIVMETNLSSDTTLKKAFEKALYETNRENYGRATIARLVFEPIPLDMLLNELGLLDEPDESIATTSSRRPFLASA